VETVAPRILERFAAVPALGGSGRPAGITDLNLPMGLEYYTEEQLRRFSEKLTDQSMVTHILNGIFAAFRLAEKVPAERALSELEKRLWLLGYVAHDYTKVFCIRTEAGDLPRIRKVVTCLGEALNFSGLLPDWQRYMDDIVFLAQNTQTKEGANLNLRDFNDLRTPVRRLENPLRMLSSIADILVHITSPSEILISPQGSHHTAENLKEKLNLLFGAERAPRLAYHKLTEVRGLLSNIINNAVMEALKVRGYEDFLYFPNGLVYLSWSTDTDWDSEVVTKAVWEKIVETVTESESFGVRRAGTGFIPSSALMELIGLEGLLIVGRQKATGLRAGHASARLYGFFTGQSDNDLIKIHDDSEVIRQLQEQLILEKGLPSDLRVDRLGEFLLFACRAIKQNFKRAPDISPALLKWLGLDHVITPDEANRQKGGTCFGWYYVAARYMKLQMRAPDDQDVEALLIRLTDQISSWVAERKLVPESTTSIARSLSTYVVRCLEIDGRRLFSTDDTVGFRQELEGYVYAKRKHRPLCSLCSSPFDAVLQEATEVPFIQQQYTGRNPLGEPILIRGICPVCRIEMILRRVKMKAINEDGKALHLYLYPTYFFTPETARVVRYFIQDLQDLNVIPCWETSLIRHLRANGFTTGSLLNYDRFILQEGEEPRSLYSGKPKYSDHDAAGLFFFALRPPKRGKRNLTDADAWALPAFYGLALPLLLNIKVAVTASFLPIYSTGADFKETAILDGPETFVWHILGRERFRVDETVSAIFRLLALYDLHLDVFAERSDEHWPQLGAVARDVATDLYYVFHYYNQKGRRTQSARRKKKGDSGRPIMEGIPEWDVELYWRIYQMLGGETGMGVIGQVVHSYHQFYEAEDLRSAYGVLKPLDLAMDATIGSDPKTERDDLALIIAGAVNDLMTRIRDKRADGRDPIWRDTNLSVPERLSKSQRLIETFTDDFLDKLFQGYCNGDRATLRERANRIRSAGHFYYLRNYGR
jgi:CRISPR-associated protein Csc3